MSADTQPLLKGPSSGYGGTDGSQPTGPPMPQPYSDSNTGQPQPAATPTAPPELETVEGYEGTTFQSDGYVAPPSYNESIDAPPPPSEERPPPPQTHVTERQARDSLLDLTGQNFCWGKKAAREMVISSITSSSAYHYKLETFSEARKSAWTYEPYYGGNVDGPHNGPAPPPWSIPMSPSTMFRSQEKTCEVPHTAYVKPCHDCNGRGKNTCCRCDGRGRCSCRSCNGSGFRTHLHVETHEHGHGHHHGHHGHHHGHHGHHHGHTHTDVHTDTTLCHHCAGTGHKLCDDCRGSGQVNCRTCNAKGALKHFIKLTVIWTVHIDDHVVESTALPDHLVRGAEGVLSFEESAIRVNPVVHFPNNAINSASQRLVQRHNSSYPSERILMQRHKIRIVPISEVQSDYSGARFTFWIYGNDNRCHAPEYPQQCCCGCTIL